MSVMCIDLHVSGIGFASKDVYQSWNLRALSRMIYGRKLFSEQWKFREERCVQGQQASFVSVRDAPLYGNLNIDTSTQLTWHEHAVLLQLRIFLTLYQDPWEHLLEVWIKKFFF